MKYNFSHRGKSFNIDIYDQNDLLSLWFRDYHHNFYEVEMLDFIADNYKEQSTIIDIGSNIGNHAMYYQSFLSYDKLVCFEPHEENFNLLCKNMKFSSKDIAYMVALGEKRKEVGLQDNFLNRGNVSIKKGQGTDMYTLDSFEFEDVSLIKLDVEEYEHNVLLGSEKTIKNYKPRIFIEVWEQHLDRIESTLLEWGYKNERSFNTDGIVVYEFSPNI